MSKARRLRLLMTTGAMALAATGCGEAKVAASANAMQPAQTDGSASGAPDVHPEAWPAVQSPVADDPEIEAEVERLLAAMTLEEKVGQIIQGDIGSVTPEDVRQYKLGSILNGGNSAPGGDLRADPADWVELADAFWDASVGPDGEGIPVLWGTDAVHGHSNIVGATIFPHNIGLGAARDPEMIERIGAATAAEIAATGLDWTFAPTLATPRNDRWGRTYEGYSEAPEIVAAYADAMVRGLQGDPNTEAFLGPDKVLATAKHFLGDGGTRDGVDQGETVATEEELRDIHGAGYAPAIEAGVQTVMASFSSWRGQKMHGYEALLSDVLVDQMGFDGFVVGDWNGHGQVAGCTPTDCPASFNAGLDMFMAPDSWKGLYETTLAAAQSGEITQERLDEAVARILRVKLRAGLPERGRPSERPLAGDFDRLGSPEHRALARESVRKSLVLLKNEGVLPIAGDMRVLVAGDGANDLGKQTGGWTLSWQGDGNSREDFPNAQTIWEGLEAAIGEAGGEAVLSEDGSYEEEPDVAVVVFGEDPYAEFRGDREDLNFADETALETMRRLQADGIPVVSVFLSGRPMWVNPEFNASDAFVAAWLPGSEGGGIADVLVGGPDGEPRQDFTGRLSFSWPKRPDQAVLNVGDADYDPLFAYGYGLTYGDDGTLAELREDYEVAGADANTILAEGDARGGRRMTLSSAEGDMLVSDATAMSPDGSLALSRTDRDAQEDSIRLQWDGSAPARFVVHAQPVDWQREANADIGLRVSYRYDEQPEAPIRYGMGEGLFTLPLGEAGEWQDVTARLTCFAEAGADLSEMAAPFVLAAEGEATVTVSDVTLVPTEAGMACPED